MDINLGDTPAQLENLGSAPDPVEDALPADEIYAAPVEGTVAPETLWPPKQNIDVRVGGTHVKNPA